MTGEPKLSAAIAAHIEAAKAAKRALRSKKRAEAREWATNEAENWFLNDEGLYKALQGVLAWKASDAAKATRLAALLGSAEVMEEADLKKVNWSQVLKDLRE